MSARLKIDTALCDKLLATLEDSADKLVREHAFRIQDMSQRVAPVDTGALRNSAYTKTSIGSNYQAAANLAKQKNPDAVIDEDIAEEVEKGSALVIYPMEYAIHVELGTSKMPSRPFLGIAGETQRPKFEKALKELIK